MREQNRNTAFDLLRLGSMVMVTVLHLTGYGLKEGQIAAFSGPYWTALVMNSFSLVAVNCFVLISGYFLSARDPAPKKLLALWGQVWTYSVGLYLLLCLAPGVDVSFRLPALVECLFPLLSNQYWFFTCYFLLYLLAPFLNRLARSWDRREYGRALALLLVIFSLVPSVNIWGDPFGTNQGYGLIWFCILYLTGAFLRKFDLRCPIHPALAYLVPCALLTGLRAAVDLLDSDMSSLQAILSNQCGYNGPLVLCASLGLFLWARDAKLQPRHPRAVTAMASLSFGIYLLHEHSALRSVLWNGWVRMGDAADRSGAFLLRALLAPAAIFAAGLAVEFLRRRAMDAAWRLVHPNTHLTGKNEHEAKKQN